MLPTYREVAPPVPVHEEQVLVTVRAAAIKQLDLLKVAGAHYTHYDTLPTVVGLDGVGVLPDGRRIYAMGLTGMMAEQALVARNRWTLLPDSLDDALAAALPNALVGADVPLRYRAKIERGDVVLINGATGSSGMMAVQLAKYHGAASVIATGRNPIALQKLLDLGADEVVSLTQADTAVVAQLQALHTRTPIRSVIDYLWGHPTELLLAALQAVPSAQTIRLVTVGEMAGATLTVDSSVLRSRDIELLGSGIGSLPPHTITHYLQHEMPALLTYAAAGQLQLDVTSLPLHDVTHAWQQAASASQRLVLTM